MGKGEEELGNLSVLTSALRVKNTELPTALSSYNFLQRIHWPFAYVSLKFVEIPDQSITLSSPQPPEGGWGIRGEWKGGNKGPWDSTGCP